MRSLWSWHDLVVGVLHVWEPLGVVSRGGACSSLADELAMHMSLAWADGDIVRRVVRADDDRWVLDGTFRLTRARNQVWTDEVATLHLAAARIHALALELELSDPDEGAWWLGISGSIIQALAEYVPTLEGELAEADVSASLIGAAMLEQLELLEYVELPCGPDGKRPVVTGELVSAECAASRDPMVYRVVLPIPSGVADAVREWRRQHSCAPVVALAVAFPFSAWIPRYLSKMWMPLAWYVGRSDLREVWCMIVSLESLSAVVSDMADLISSDIDARICCATSDRMLWAALASELRAVAEAEVPL